MVLLGGGLQASLPYRSGIKRPQDESVKAFIGAIMDRSGSVGVRGEWTQDYLQQLGFKDVEVIGCPSMFMCGDKLDVQKQAPALDADSRITINVTSRISEMGPIVESHTANYPNLTYIGQEMDCLRLLLWGEGIRKMADPNPLPGLAVAPARARRQDEAVGRPVALDRLPARHGLHVRHPDPRQHRGAARRHARRTSSAHDTRTTELARYFEIPHKLISEITPETDAAELYAEADYGPLNANHKKRYDTFIGYVERHGLSHVFQPGEDPTLFEQKVASIRYPDSVALYSGSAYQRYSRADEAHVVGGDDPRRPRERLHV